MSDVRKTRAVQRFWPPACAAVGSQDRLCQRQSSRPPDRGFAAGAAPNPRLRLATVAGDGAARMLLASRAGRRRGGRRARDKSDDQTAFIGIRPTPGLFGLPWESPGAAGRARPRPADRACGSIPEPAVVHIANCSQGYRLESRLHVDATMFGVDGILFRDDISGCGAGGFGARRCHVAVVIGMAAIAVE